MPDSSPSTETNTTPVVMWCLTDGRAGHRSQIDGLLGHLGERRSVDVHWIPIQRLSKSDVLGEWLRRQFTPGEDLPAPQLIIAAGHATHTPALAARRAHGGQAVVLMRPSLPTSWFDLCLIPDHDLHSGFARSNKLGLDRLGLTGRGVVSTRGVLNAMTPAHNTDASRGLILIGGPSKHHDWSNSDILQQVDALLSASRPNIDWTLTTSPRTPSSLVDQLVHDKRFTGEDSSLTIVPFADTPSGWLKGQLATVGAVFVSEDSVSMVYEALTAGAHVGLLRVPRRRHSRVVRGVDQLIDDRLVIPFDVWQQHGFAERRTEPFNEAARCAEIVCDRLLDAA